MPVLERFQLSGQVAVVTGAFGKLGPIWAKSLLEAGAKVAAIELPGAIPSEPVQALKAKFGEKLAYFEADVTSRQSLEAVCAAIEQTLGAVSVLVNNAGIDQPPGKQTAVYELVDIPVELLERVVSVNTLGAFQCMQVFGKRMIAKGSGSIINIGSLYASVSPDVRFYDHIEQDVPFIKPPGYGASKAALINLTKYFATHMAPRGVRVNALSPGGVEGGQDADFKRKFCARVPMARMAQADDLSGPLLFLASEAAAYVTGVELIVDGGYTVW